MDWETVVTSVTASGAVSALIAAAVARSDRRLQRETRDYERLQPLRDAKEAAYVEVFALMDEITMFQNQVAIYGLPEPEEIDTRMAHVGKAADAALRSLRAANSRNVEWFANESYKSFVQLVLAWQDDDPQADALRQYMIRHQHSVTGLVADERRLMLSPPKKKNFVARWGRRQRLRYRAYMTRVENAPEKS
jgi:hypothetical protein